MLFFRSAKIVETDFPVPSLAPFAVPASNKQHIVSFFLIIALLLHGLLDYLIVCI